MAPWVPSTRHAGYLALTPSGNEGGPGYDSWYPLGYQNFAASIYTTFFVASPGTYSFGTFSDDGSALYVDGSLVVNNGGEHAPQDAFSTVFLTAGTHQLLVNYYEGQPLFQANLTAYMAVPEPAGWAGIGGGLLLLGAIVRKVCA